jgi:DNA-directed RNA polymerase specialized sigma24 family protein
MGDGCGDANRQGEILSAETMQKLEREHPRKCRVVELRFFGGLTIEEVAVSLNVSPDSVKRDWRIAKLWLLRELSEGQRPG